MTFRPSFIGRTFAQTGCLRYENGSNIMILLLAVAPILAGIYLAYCLFLLKKVNAPVYNAQGKESLSAVSYFIFTMGLVLLVFFIAKNETTEALLVVALILTALIGVLLFRVCIGENGIFHKLRFHPWSEFGHYRWKKYPKQGFWVLYLYNDVNSDLIQIRIQETRVSRLDLILQNKAGLDYLERK